MCVQSCSLPPQHTNKNKEVESYLEFYWITMLVIGSFGISSRDYLKWYTVFYNNSHTNRLTIGLLQLAPVHSVIAPVLNKEKTTLIYKIHSWLSWCDVLERTDLSINLKMLVYHIQRFCYEHLSLMPISVLVLNWFSAKIFPYLCSIEWVAHNQVSNLCK